MARTLPSATQLAFELIAELRPFYDVLRRNDQFIMDEFFEDALQHRDAISHAGSLLPMEVIPYLILLEEHKKNNKTKDELCKLIEEQDRKITQLAFLLYLLLTRLQIIDEYQP